MSMYVRRIGSPIKPMTPSDVRYGSLADIGERSGMSALPPKADIRQRKWTSA